MVQLRYGLGVVSLRCLGAISLGFAAMGFFTPNALTQLWPCKLTPLTARVFSGWFALLGVGGMVISGDMRWSAWRVGLQSTGLWHRMVVIGAVDNQADFTCGLLNWYMIDSRAIEPVILQTAHKVKRGIRKKLLPDVL